MRYVSSICAIFSSVRLLNHEGMAKLLFPKFLYNSRFVSVTLLELCFCELAEICPNCDQVSEN